MSPLVCPAAIYTELYVSRNHDENFSRSIPSRSRSPNSLVGTGLEDKDIAGHENKFTNRDKALSDGTKVIKGTLRVAILMWEMMEPS